MLGQGLVADDLKHYNDMITVFSEFNPLKTKRRLLYLNTQFVPRSKLFISVIKTDQFIVASGTSRCLFSDKYKTHKYSVGRAYSCLMLNCWCIT